MRNLMEEFDKERNLMEEFDKERNLMEEFDKERNLMEEFDETNVDGLNTLKEQLDQQPQDAPLMIEQEQPGWLEKLTKYLPTDPAGAGGYLAQRQMEEAPLSTEEIVAEAKTALEIIDAHRRFAMGFLAYGLETAPARSVRGVPSLISLGRIEPVMTEKTMPMKLDNFIMAGTKAAKGDIYISADYLLNRMFTTSEEMRKVDDFFVRHPKLAISNRVAVIIDDMIVAMIAEAAATRGAIKGVHYIDDFFRGTTKHQLRKGFHVALKEASDKYKLGEEITEMWKQPKLTNADEVAEALTKKHGFAVTGEQVTEVVLPHSDDLVKTSLTKSYLKEATTPRLPGQEPPINPALVNSLIEQHTFGKYKSIKDINRLKLIELTNITDDIGTMINAPTSVKYGTELASKVHLPAWRFYDRLGLWNDFSRVDDGIYRADQIIDSWERWLRGNKRLYKKLFKQSWDEAADKATFHAIQQMNDGVTPASVLIPDDILNKLPPDKIERIRGFIIDTARVHKYNYMDELAEEAIKQGKIGGTTGIPVQKWYITNIDKATLQQQIDGLAREGFRTRSPKKFFAPEFARRRENINDIAESFENLGRIGIKHQSKSLFKEPPLTRMGNIIHGAYPKEVQDYFDAWKKHAVFKHPAKSDAFLNKGLNKVSSKIETITNGKWKATGASWENLSMRYRQSVAGGALMGNIRPIFKNTFQSSLTDDLIGTKATLAGMESMFFKGGRNILGKFGFMHNRAPFAGIDITNSRTWNRLSYGGIAAVDKYMNCASSANGTLWRLVRQNSSKMDELVEFTAKNTGALRPGAIRKGIENFGFWDALDTAIDAGKFVREVDMAKKVTYASQWTYHLHGMGRYAWSSTGRTAGQFQNWTAHFWGAHMPQMVHQLLGGDTILGMQPTAWERMALFRFLARGAIFHEIGTNLGYNMDHMTILHQSGVSTAMLPIGKIRGEPMPFPTSPGTQFADSFFQMAYASVTGDDKRYDRAYDSFARAITLTIPAITAARRLDDIETEGIGTLIMTPIKREKSTGGLKTLKGFEGLKGLKGFE